MIKTEILKKKKRKRKKRKERKKTLCEIKGLIRKNVYKKLSFLKNISQKNKQYEIK